MLMWRLTKEELEEFLDVAKVAVLHRLVQDGMIDGTVADEWAASHTVVSRKKKLWRTITSRWNRVAELKGEYLVVVHAPVEDTAEEETKGEPDALPENPPEKTG